MIRYEFHLPVDIKEAKKRKLDPCTAQILIQSDDEKEFLQSAGEFIYETKLESRQLVGQTIVCYDSPRKIGDALAANNIRHWFDCDLNKSIKKANNLLIPCLSANEIRTILQINSEATVFYNLDFGRDIMFNEAIIDASLDGYIESNFLKFVNAVGYFVFCSKTHSSIEILGQGDLVKNCFSKLIQHHR